MEGLISLALRAESDCAIQRYTSISQSMLHELVTGLFHELCYTLSGFSHYTVNERTNCLNVLCLCLKQVCKDIIHAYIRCTAYILFTLRLFIMVREKKNKKKTIPIPHTFTTNDFFWKLQVDVCSETATKITIVLLSHDPIVD